MHNMVEGENQQKSSYGDGQDNSAKFLLFFVTGILLIGFVIFMVNDSRNRKTAQDNLTSTPVEEVQLDGRSQIQQDQSTPPPSPTVTPELTNLESEEQGMTNDNLGEKMTVEQKLAAKAPTTTLDTEKSYTATLKTTMGDIVIALDAKNRPATVNNFVYLANMGFYDDVVFHRVIANFMIQGGDPLGTGTGGPAYKFADELSAPNSNAKGTISMANAGSNTNGSQFFINLVDNTYLDSKHSVFGRVTSGMDVVEAIGKVKTGQNDRPVTPVKIESVEIAAE
jgi:peptidylprolyl isomerase